MRPQSTQRSAVRRIAIRTATLALVGVGSVLALGATWAPNQAEADGSTMTPLSAEAVGDGPVRYHGDASTGNRAEPPAEAGYPGSLGGELAPAPEPGALCCVSSAGSCTVLYGTACPSGSTQTICPCNPPL